MDHQKTDDAQANNQKHKGRYNKTNNAVAMVNFTFKLSVCYFPGLNTRFFNVPQNCPS